jgi:reactive chlorine resistance protein C
LFSWLHAALGTRATSNVIGTAEIAIASLIAARRRAPMASAIGSIISIGMFLSTLSFMFSTPSLWHFAEWYPLPVTNDAGFFLMKDIFLLGAAIWTAGEALGAAGGGPGDDMPASRLA